MARCTTRFFRTSIGWTLSPASSSARRSARSCGCWEADIAGFGSDLTWNLEGDLAFLASRYWTIGAGWCYMDIDYDGGEGIERR
jgi:hypothetical protein